MTAHPPVTAHPQIDYGAPNMTVTPAAALYEYGYAHVAGTDITPAVRVIEAGGWEVTSINGTEAAYVGIVFRRLEHLDAPHLSLNRVLWVLRSCGSARDRRQYEADPHKFDTG